MATQKSTQPARDGAIEGLLAEIASVAYLTDRGPQARVGEVEALEHENTALRSVISRMGWLADIALHRLGSDNCLRQGKANAWLLPCTVSDALAQAVPS